MYDTWNTNMICAPPAGNCEAAWRAERGAHQRVTYLTNCDVEDDDDGQVERPHGNPRVHQQRALVQELHAEPEATADAVIRSPQKGRELRDVKHQSEERPVQPPPPLLNEFHERLRDVRFRDRARNEVQRPVPVLLRQELEAEDLRARRGCVMRPQVTALCASALTRSSARYIFDLKGPISFCDRV